MYKKLVLFLPILLLLFSCNRNPTPWEKQDIKRALKSIYSTRIFYTPRCPYSEVGLSFVFDHCGDKAYLFLLYGGFNNSNTKNLLEFTYVIDAQAYTGILQVMKGRQVAELNKESREHIFEALKANKTVVIQVGDYQSIFPSCNFTALLDDKFGIHNCLPRIVYEAIPIF
ncbi:MAG: hypothetical protein NTY13_04510 [Chlamydiae bacterium]|nr:hypothetical protein [Chlamydiota bacterium]